MLSENDWYESTYCKIPFIIHSENDETIAVENISVVVRYWVYEEAITIKQQEGDSGGDETVLCPNCDTVMQIYTHIKTYTTVMPPTSILFCKLKK